MPPFLGTPWIFLGQCESQSLSAVQWCFWGWLMRLFLLKCALGVEWKSCPTIHSFQLAKRQPRPTSARLCNIQTIIFFFYLSICYVFRLYKLLSLKIWKYITLFRNVINNLSLDTRFANLKQCCNNLQCCPHCQFSLKYILCWAELVPARSQNLKS